MHVAALGIRDWRMKSGPLAGRDGVLTNRERRVDAASGSRLQCLDDGTQSV